jgi:hypothetical protein
MQFESLMNAENIGYIVPVPVIGTKEKRQMVSLCDESTRS